MLARLVDQVVSSCIGLQVGLVYQLEASIDNIVALQSKDAMSLSDEVLVVTLFDQDKQSVLEDGSNLSSAAEEGTLLVYRLDEGLHGDGVVVL